ncbi:MAG: alpha/beta hydrolase fold domain-containing protein [Kofleriaceae bacterium]|nr:alpha/beta hydrolase fold domain-containing protein [Kofleriaceae bacterium]
MDANVALGTGHETRGDGSITRIPLSPHDVAALPRLREKLAQFWSKTGEDPRTQFARFAEWTPIASGVTFDEDSQGTWSEPTNAVPREVILHLHGGAYTKGSAHAFRGFASQIAARTHRTVFSLNYPLAPEAHVPVAFDLVVSTLARLCAMYDSVSIVGDSAGGGLVAASLSEVAWPITAVVLFSPWLDLTLSGASMTDPSIHDPLLARDRLADSAHAYLGDAPPDDPRASPLFAIPQQLPPLLIQVGTDELLLDDSRRYAAAARRAGLRVQLEEWEAMHHVFQMSVAELEGARRALDRAAQFLTT